MLNSENKITSTLIILVSILRYWSTWCESCSITPRISIYFRLHFSRCSAFLVKINVIAVIPSLQTSIFNVHPGRWIPKEELLSQNNADVAVQISAMETTIINETKEWLKQQGINLDILKGKRQDCLISIQSPSLYCQGKHSSVSEEMIEKWFRDKSLWF